MAVSAEPASPPRQKNDAEIRAELTRKGHMAFSWDDLEKLELSNGIVTSLYRVGMPDESSSPTVFKVYYPPDCFVEAHTHECDYTEIVVEGSQARGRHLAPCRRHQDRPRQPRLRAPGGRAAGRDGTFLLRRRALAGDHHRQQ